MADVVEARRRRTFSTSRSGEAADGAYPPPSYYNPYFHARQRRRWQMWLKRDDGVLLVRRGAVKPQMVPYPLPSYCQC